MNEATSGNGQLDHAAESVAEWQIGKYTVIRQIGSGGMADVFLCRLSGLGGFDKKVVVKTILPQYAEDEEFIRMFLDEARIAAYLNHPSIIQIFEVDEVNNVPFIAMEYVSGPTLSALSSAARREGNLRLPLLARIVTDVADGLAYAHAIKDDTGEPLG